MYKFRGELQEQGIIFCYSGYMTEEVLTGIGDAIKKKLRLENTEKAVSRTIFSVFVEQVQNVIRYSAERVEDDRIDDATELRYGVLTVGLKNDSYFVSCGNKIINSDVERLDNALGHIKNLDKDGLKDLYKKTLKGETPKGSKGAGVGFIDIARRAEDFDYDFMKIDDEFSYFCLMAYV